MSWEERFWAKVDKTGDCWVWTGANSNGYGNFNREGQNVNAHKVSYEIANGPTPTGMYIYRSCEKPLCVRPEHLYFAPRKEPWAARFWEKVDKDGPIPAHNPALGNCWVWTASISGGGYGSFCFDSKTVSAHHFIYERMFVTIPDGMYVLHKCDNKLCVRLDHLYPGTPAQNDRDAVSRGLKVSGDRHWSRRNPEKIARGERNGDAKLTETQVLKMREMYTSGGYRHIDLAKKFGVSKALVGKICRNELWTWLPSLSEMSESEHSYQSVP